MAEPGTLPAALAAALLLIGCAGGPPPAESHRPVLPDAAPWMPVAGATPAAPAEIDRWWTAFDDGALEARIVAALAHNADLAIAAARLLAARAQRDQAAGAARPQLEVEIASGRSRSPGAPDGPARTGSAHRAALTAEHELDLWGRLSSGTQAARERLQAQAWARASIAWSLTAQVAEAHFALRATARQLEIAEAVQQGRRHEVELRRAQVRAGAAPELDLRRAEAELAAAEVARAALARRGVALQGTLALLTGQPLPALVRGDGPPAPPLDPARPVDLRLPAGPLAGLLERRPDLRQAEAELRAAKADVAAARAATLPAVRLTGSVGSDVRQLSDLFGGAGFAWSLASGVVHSLVDGGQAEARAREREALSDAARARYRQAVAAAVNDVREAYLAYDLDAEALRAEHGRVAALARALQLARIGHAAGVATQLDVLDAQRQHFQAQLAEVDAYRARLLGQVAAFKALGGGPSGDAAAFEQPS